MIYGSLRLVGVVLAMSVGLASPTLAERPSVSALTEYLCNAAVLNGDSYRPASCAPADCPAGCGTTTQPGDVCEETAPDVLEVTRTTQGTPVCTGLCVDDGVGPTGETCTQTSDCTLGSQPSCFFTDLSFNDASFCVDAAHASCSPGGCPAPYTCTVAPFGFFAECVYIPADCNSGPVCPSLDATATLVVLDGPIELGSAAPVNCTKPGVDLNINGSDASACLAAIEAGIGQSCQTLP